jgi:hypothetical protein
MIFTLATVIGLQFNHTILSKLLIYLISQPPVANDGHASDGHASTSIERNLRMKYAAQIAGNGVSGLQISNIFGGGGWHAPVPPS